MSMNASHCTQCYVGRYQVTGMPYLAWVNDYQFVVPDVPGYQCDICGDSFHDPDFIHHLHHLIDRSTVSGQHNLAPKRQVATGGGESGQSIGRSAKS